MAKRETKKRSSSAREDEVREVYEQLGLLDHHGHCPDATAVWDFQDDIRGGIILTTTTSNSSS